MLPKSLILCHSKQRLLALSFVCAILCLISSISCTVQKAPTRSFTVSDLMIDESSLPDGWVLYETLNEPIVSFGEQEAYEIIFYYVGDTQKLTRGGIAIYQHKSSSRASWHFEKEQITFQEDSAWHQGPTFILEGFEFIPAHADQWRFGCRVTNSKGLFEDGPNCYYFARYDEFFVDLTISVEYSTQPTITPNDLSQLVSDVDQQITQYLIP